MSQREVVITGLGVVSPLGVGLEAYRNGLAAAQSVVAPLTMLDTTYLPSPFGAEIKDFDGKQYVRPRKSLKVMSRDIQTAYAAADMAMQHAGLEKGAIEPERLGVVFGSDMIFSEVSDLEDALRACMVDGQLDINRWGEAAMSKIYPLWMLKYLPNYPACHVGIVHDARGPNNSITLGEASSLLAMAEATSVIRRGLADAMLTGGTGSRFGLGWIAFLAADRLSRRKDNPAAASRPFDADRDGIVYGEGSAVMLLESRQHAEARGAKILGRILGWASTYENRRFNTQGDGSGYRRAIEIVLDRTGVRPEHISHVNAHGESSIENDAHEAQAIRDTLGDVPVLAMKSYFGNLGAGGGAVELLASLAALETGQIPVTLNYETPDPRCPVNVVHTQPANTDKNIVLKLNQSDTGQTAALLIAGP